MSALLVIVVGMLWLRSQESAEPDGELPAAIQVVGDVPAPGWYELPEPGVHAAVRAAGGDPGALPDAPLADGTRLTVSAGGAGAPTFQIAPAGSELVLELPVLINSASAASLEALPGVGPSLAAAILAEREQAPFIGPEDLERVRGIGPAKAAAVAPFVSFGETTPPDPASPAGDPPP